MKPIIAAVLTAAPFASFAQVDENTDIKCSGWELDRHFILQSLEETQEVAGDLISDPANVSDEALRTAQAITAANEKAMSNFMETKRLFVDQCGE
ncbi:hypothetical protein [Roseivivax isoporae]|uniref:Uncharacterized protein n=1 Tax=Roseivivax isoporae LMG 25204 TaxID=1449351 RepID=X7F0Y7_9RHOB|nr:hypothetical protein [Roseivivax isoporae]ETX26440.1 hypothetical protein RISW2_03760 [Roseivivax isoporae LMG 25204]